MPTWSCWSNNAPDGKSHWLVKRAFITGIAGQDGSYLAELLVQKGYEVHGTVRSANNPRLSSLSIAGQLHLHVADLDDAVALQAAIRTAAPDELYHLASQSHVGQSFETLEVTCRLATLGTLRVLEIARESNGSVRIFNASSSEIFGSPETAPQNESTPVAPVTPYGCAKAFATQITRVYRQTFGLFAVNGILFNHESPRRGENFVTRKICRAAARIKMGQQSELVLGDTSAERDWGHARDYVRGMWMSLQHGSPQDYIFATGKLHRVQDIIEIAFQVAGLNWRDHVKRDEKFLRPADPRRLVGDPSRARRDLGWEPEVSFEETISEMTRAELQAVKI